MKTFKLFTTLFFLCLIGVFSFGQEVIGQEWESNNRECFCCSPFYNLPSKPQINYTPYGHPDFPTAICPCNTNVIKTNSCSGASYSWVISSKIPGGGVGNATFSGPINQSSVTINNASLDIESEITVTVTISCGNKKVTNSKIIPILNGADPSNFSYVANMNSSGTGTLTITGLSISFGQGWTVKYWNLPNDVPCGTWQSGPFLGMGSGSTLTLNGLQEGKFYRIAHYVERCEKTWKASNCRKIAYKCFTILSSSGSSNLGKVAQNNFTKGAQIKDLGNGLKMYIHETLALEVDKNDNDAAQIK